MLLEINPVHPEPRKIRRAVDALQAGDIVAYPTDTVYGMGCDLFNRKSIDRLYQLKGIDKGQKLAFLCGDLADVSKYAMMHDHVYRILKQYLPGPYTFILGASKQVPKMLKTRKDTVGIRVPDNAIARCIVEELGNPILSASLPGEYVEEYTDPEIIHDKFGNLVDMVIDGGIGGIVPSTVVDFTSDEPELIRLGAGEWNG